MSRMSPGIDVYQVLKAFSTRNKINVVDYRVFTQAIQRQARSYDQTVPFYRDLALHPEGILAPKLMQLAREKRVSILTVGNQIDRIFLPEAFTEPVYQEYRRIEENPEVPFPDESALKLSIPAEWIQQISVENDLPSLIGFEGDRPALLYRVVFPEGLKSLVCLSVSVADKLLEYSILKIRNYLRKGSNKDFIHQRLASAFNGKELLLKDSITGILIKPFDMIEEMRQGKSDFIYPFWAYLTSSIKKDLAGKGDPTPDDMAAWQAAFLVDVYNNHYKGRAQREQDREAAFKTLETQLAKPPFLFSIQDIVDFRDSQGRPLLGKYTREELEEWIHVRSTQADATGLPFLMVVPVGSGRTLLIARDRLLPYVVKSLHEARPLVKTAITRDWQALLYDFDTCAAMQDDDSFRADLLARLARASPILYAVLDAKLAPAVFSATRGSRGDDSTLERCFGGSRTAPPDLLLDLNRKRLVTDVRMLLPFWYTVPVLSWFISLFKRASRRQQDKKSALRTAIREESAGDTPARAPGNTRAAEFATAAAAAEKTFLPKGYRTDEYLQLLADKWNTLLEPAAKANLTEDINSLVRDYLRGALRNMRPSAFTPDRITTMASNLADTPNLLKIRNHASLEEYIRLYMVKVLRR